MISFVSVKILNICKQCVPYTFLINTSKSIMGMIIGRKGILIIVREPLFLESSSIMTIGVIHIRRIYWCLLYSMTSMTTIVLSMRKICSLVVHWTMIFNKQVRIWFFSGPWVVLNLVAKLLNISGVMFVCLSLFWILWCPCLRPVQ